jgi:spore coat protein U-like protein
MKIKAWFGVWLGVLAVPSALAAGTSPVNVSATVIGNCRFNTTSATMNFGTLDPANATNATATAALQFWCTKNAAYTMSDNGGANRTGAQRRMKDAGTNYINYAIAPYAASGTGTGRTTAITLNLNGTVNNADYVNAAAGAYADVVTFTINP